MSEGKEGVVLLIWNDCRELIEYLKNQRWDVAKWSVLVNVGLASAAAIRSDVRPMLLVFAIAVSVVGCWLLFHYNRRVTRVRERLRKIGEYVARTTFDFNKEMGLDIAGPKSEEYDWQELRGFYLAIILSLLPVVLVVFAANGPAP